MTSAAPGAEDRPWQRGPDECPDDGPDEGPDAGVVPGRRRVVRSLLADRV